MCRRLPLGLVPLLLGLALAAPGRAASLEDALIRAYLDNPALLAGRAGLRATDETVPEALAGWRPRLEASVGQGLDQVESSDGASALNTRRYALALAQPLYTGGATAADTRRAESAVQAGRARLRALEQAVLLEVVAAFTGTVREQAVLELAGQNERRLETQLDAARHRFRLGDLTRTDVAQAETRLARAVAERIAAEGALAAAAAAYRRVVGVAPDRLVAPERPGGLPAAEAEALALADDAPAVLAAGFDLDAARAATDLAIAALKPRLTLEGELGYVDEPSVLLDWQRSMRVGATLAVPLYQGGGEYARVRRTRQTAQQRRHELDEAHRRAEEEIAAAWQALATETARIRSLELQVDRAAFAVEGVRREALVGARTVLDVLDAEQELFAAEVELVRGRREEVLAAFGLMAATGALTAERLGLAVLPYDARAHYLEVRDKWFGLGEDLPDAE